MRFTTRPTIGVLLAAGWSVLGSSAHADILHVPGDFPTIQAAIDAAMDGDEVEVHPGTYNENINLLGKAITVRSSDGPEVTTIDAGGSGRVVTCTNEEGPDTVLDGFTLTGGNASEGGGIFFDDSQATINNCAIIGNVADDGAGIKCLGSSPMISNCTISENFTPNWGGGIYCRINSSPTIINCTISDNTAAGDGGGGISCSSNSSPSITNCVFRGNAAAGGGAIRCNNNSNPIITNCTFSGNLALGLGGGIYNAGGIATLDNCILWGDNAHDGPEIALAGSSSVLTVSYCDVQGGQGDVSIGDASTLNWVSGNIDFDPLFVDPDNANVHLSPGSPCIDAANNEAVPAGVVTDLDGNPRFVDNPDSDDCWQAPGTCGEAPIVDMGSYENQGGGPSCANRATRLIRAQRTSPGTARWRRSTWPSYLVPGVRARSERHDPRLGSQAHGYSLSEAGWIRPQDHEFYFEVTAERDGHRHIARAPDRESAVAQLGSLVGYPLDE